MQPVDAGPLRFGKYEVLEAVGHGAMGTIYRARDPHIDRLVAVKAMTATAASDPDRRQRFTMEAKMAGQLSHENLVKVYDLGAQDGVPYIAMEYLEGTDLKTIIRDRIELLSEKKLNILIQIARGLSYAHKRGVVHRDIKPENIRLLEDGVVKIMDFGIAMRADERADGEGFHGTVAYMAPERLQGQEGTPASDLWAVGVLAYELLTFTSPFPADNYAAMMERITSGQPVPMDLSKTLVHPELQRVVMKLLAREPRDRYRSADELLEELEEFVSEEATRRKEAQTAFNGALEEYRKGNLKAAMRGWEEALRLEPDHFPARSHLKMASERMAGLREVKLLGKLADFYMEQQRPDRALTFYQDVLAIDPHHVAAHEAVRVLGGLGERPASKRAAPLPVSAKSASSVKLPALPPGASPEVRRALAAVKKERLAEGITILRDALERHPADALVQDYLARIVLRVKKRVFKEKALVQKYIEKGNACFRTERFAEAEEQWNRVLAIDGENVIARKNLEVLAGYLKDQRVDEDIAYPEGRRHHLRLPANSPARYRGLFSPQAGFRAAELHRLSISGMSLLTAEAVPVSAVIEVSFEIPATRNTVEVLAQVVHVVAEPFGRQLVGTVLLLVPEAYVEFLKTLA